MAYPGPKVGFAKGDLSFDAGYGKLTAGMLSLTGKDPGRGKSFGVNGQDNGAYDA